MKNLVEYIKEGLKITSKTKVNERPKYNYYPKTKRELQNLLKQLVKERGNEGDFNDIDKFNGDISYWNVSNVTDMGAMFNNSKFNKDISKWDVSNVTSMIRMFENCPLEKNLPKWYKK